MQGVHVEAKVHHALVTKRIQQQRQRLAAQRVAQEQPVHEQEPDRIDSSLPEEEDGRVESYNSVQDRPWVV